MNLDFMRFEMTYLQKQSSKLEKAFKVSNQDSDYHRDGARDTTKYKHSCSTKIQWPQP